VRKGRRKETEDIEDESDIEKSVPFLSVPEVVELITNDRDSLFFFYENQVIRIENLDNFHHPGGPDLLKEYNGKDISGIISGTDSFSDQGRQRFLAHSNTAVKQLLEFRVGQIAGPSPAVGDNSTVMGGTLAGLMDELAGPPGGMFSIDEEGKSVAVVTSVETLNTSEKFPVKRLLLKVLDPVLMMRANAGMKIRLSLSPDDDAVERTYTIVSVEQGKLELIIKMYPEGTLTSQLANIGINHPMFLAKLAPAPRLSNSLEGSYLFIAGGTGIVPLMYYIDSIKREGLHAHVIWSLRERADVFFINKLNDAINDGGIRVTVMFTGEETPSGPDLGFHQDVEVRPGRISNDQLRQAINETEAISAIMSGPSNFVKEIHSNISSLGVDGNRILSLD
jgi:ferredoxin-NADP reductase